MQKEPMLYDPATGQPDPTPTNAKEYREAHGKIAWLFNPWTKAPRDARDIGSDTFGHLIHDGRSPIETAKPTTVIRPLTPVWRKEIAECFVDIALIPGQEIDGGYRVGVPLRFGKTFDLLAISQTDEALANGLLDITDYIDPAICLKSIFIQYNGVVSEIDLLGHPLGNFVYPVSGNYKDMRLDAVFSISPEKNQTYITIKVSGTVNLQFGILQMNAESEATNDGRLQLLAYTLQASRVKKN